MTPPSTTLVEQAADGADVSRQHTTRPGCRAGAVDAGLCALVWRGVATSCSSLAGSGTRSGTPATSPPESPTASRSPPHWRHGPEPHSPRPCSAFSPAWPRSPRSLPPGRPQPNGSGKLDHSHRNHRAQVHNHGRKHAMSSAPQVLFVCVHNAGRSQMAAALLNHHAAGRVTVRSAGSAPADAINPTVREAMAERVGAAHCCAAPPRTVHATRRRTRLKQAAGALRVVVLASCVCGLGARAGRRRVSSGFGSCPACRARHGGRGTRRRLPAGPRSATSVPIPVETGWLVVVSRWSPQSGQRPACLVSRRRL